MSDAIAIPPVGADESSQAKDACRSEELRYGTHAADVFFAILGAKAQSETLSKRVAMHRFQDLRRCTQTVPNVIPIEQIGVNPHVIELAIDGVGYCALA